MWSSLDLMPPGYWDKLTTDEPLLKRANQRFMCPPGLKLVIKKQLGFQILNRRQKSLRITLKLLCREWFVRVKVVEIAEGPFLVLTHTPFLHLILGCCSSLKSRNWTGIMLKIRCCCIIHMFCSASSVSSWMGKTSCGWYQVRVGRDFYWKGFK